MLHFAMCGDEESTCVLLGEGLERFDLIFLDVYMNGIADVEAFAVEASG